MMKTVVFLPVKGTSSRVQNKNMRIFNGEPLFVFTLRKLLKCSFIDEVYLDSENEEILEIGRRLGAKLLPRDPALADNKTDGHQLFYNEVKQVDADIYIQHLCTSPFVKEETIRKAIQILKDDDNCDTVVLGKDEKYYHWEEGKPAYDIEHIPNSVDLPSELTEAMALYVMRGDVARRTKRRIGDAPCMIVGEPTELIDINLEEDLELATIVGAGILAEEEKRLKLLGRFLSSPILSDICDELNIPGVLAPEYKSNIDGAKMFGRARTLHIREAAEDDPDDCIYDALQSYKQVVSNDLIVVKNDLPHLAYFGELNMSLSIRSGAVGAIIAGVTRDTRATAEAGFPVFAKGNYCKDIKGRGAVQSINQPIELDGVLIEPSDLIFADQDGVVVIPRKREVEVLKRAIEVMTAEKNIVADVCKDVDVEGLVRKYGFF
jgi:regulator of RNase E activity RraA/CMP-N-acetylneuraminic acid synthetase